MNARPSRGYANNDAPICGALTVAIVTLGIDCPPTVVVVRISMNAKTIRTFASETAKTYPDHTSVPVHKATRCLPMNDLVKTLTNAKMVAILAAAANIVSTLEADSNV